MHIYFMNTQWNNYKLRICLDENKALEMMDKKVWWQKYSCMLKKFKELKNARNKNETQYDEA